MNTQGPMGRAGIGQEPQECFTDLCSPLKGLATVISAVKFQSLPFRTSGVYLCHLCFLFRVCRLHKNLPLAVCVFTQCQMQQGCFQSIEWNSGDLSCPANYSANVSGNNKCVLPALWGPEGYPGVSGGAVRTLPWSHLFRKEHI